jgi:raffinose/stachyose/melibiose transport system substrate-binding protein
MILLALGLAMLASACSHPNREGNPSAMLDRSDVAAKQVTLRYTSYLLDAAQSGKAYYESIAEFEAQYPGINIEADFIQNANYSAGVKIRLLGGEKIDVFDAWSPSLFEEFRQLRDPMYLDLTGMEFLNDMMPSYLAPVTVEGRVLGAPEVMHSNGLLYNKTLFDSLELKVPGTWAQFLEVCQTLKEHGIIPISTDSEWSTAQFFWGPIMSNNGADEEWTRKLESGEIPINNPLFVDAIRKHKEIIDRGYVPENWKQLKAEQAKDLISQGKAAMMPTGTWSMLSIKERNPKNEIAFMTIPGETTTVPNINIGTYRVINAKTEYPEEARLFVEFMNGKANQEELSAKALAVPSIVAAQVHDPVMNGIASLLRREDAALYWPHTVSTESLQTKIQEGVNKYLGGGTLQDSLNEIQAAIDELNKTKR